MEAIEYQAMHAQELRLWWYRSLHDILLDRLHRLEPARDAHLLDAGCGSGGFLQKIQPVFPAFRLTGIEYHADAIGLLRNIPGVSIVQGSVNTMPFPGDCFDIVTLTDVLYHRNISPVSCLSECRRVLKRGGHLLVNVSAYNWMHSAHDKQVHTRERYTARRCRQQLEAAGFTLHRVGYWNSLLFPAMALHRLTTGKLKSDSDVAAASPWLNELFYRIISGERWMQQHHIHLPFGGSVWAWATRP